MKRTFVNQSKPDAIATAARELGEAMRTAREARGESQDAAAAAAGTWQKSVSLLERGNVGRSMQLVQLLRLIDRYGLKIVLVEKDVDVARYRAERAAASTRRSPQRDLFAEAKAEYQRAIGGNARSA